MRNPNDDRDPYRTPMQWNDNANAGFTSGNNPWLKVNDNYKEVNVKAQDSTDNQKSHLAVSIHLPINFYVCIVCTIKKRARVLAFYATKDQPI